MNIPVLFENADYVVISKPALLDCQNSKPDRYSLVQWLEEKYKFSGLLHRLDFGTSGVMVCAKNPKAAKEISCHFLNEDSINKVYFAVVMGKPPQTGTITVPIDGKSSETRFEVQEEFLNGALMKVQLISGRKHQIRKHFFGSGYPIMGDHLYKKGGSHLLMKRPALHAYELEIQGQRYQAPLASDIEELLQRLRKRKADFKG